MSQSGMRFSWVLLACTLNSASAAPVRELTWDEASQFNGKSIRVIMAGGAALTGRAIAFAPRAMVLRVSKTANATQYPRGELRIPRDTLRTFEVENKSKHWRVLGTTLGFVAGAAAAAGIEVSGGVLAPSNTGRDVASIAVFAAGPVGGYLLGNAADRRTINVVIVGEKRGAAN